MKKTLLTLAIAAIVAASAGSLAFNVRSASLNRQPDDHDPELAATIRRMAKPSSEGLTARRNPHGGTVLDLQDRFQDLAIVKLDPEGDPAVGCVDSLDEANHFFGRNLETGEVYPEGSPVDTQEYLRTKHAAPGMTIDEFLLYKEMIRRAAPRLMGGGGSADSTTGTNTADNTSAFLTSDLTATNHTVINIINSDGASEGFNDPTAATPEGGNNGTTLGQQRLNLFNFAATVWSSYVDTTVPINVQATFDPMTPCSSSGGVLGSAGTIQIFGDFPHAEVPGTWYPSALANKLAGSDQDTSSADIRARFNSSVDKDATGNPCLGTGRTFYYGLDGASPSGRINLLVVLLHELGHGLGFQTFVNASTGAEAKDTSGTPFPDVFERHIFDRSTGKFWNQMTDAERQASAMNNGNLVWDGANIDQASKFLTAGRDSNGRVQLYAPTTYSAGSSVSHWDTPATPNLLMEPFITAGLSASDLDLTKQQLRDIGWYRDVNGDLLADTISNVAITGTNLTVGQPGQVTWTNSAGFSANVSVELSTDGGNTFPTVLGSNVQNTGSFTFTVPNLPTTQAKIRVREYDFVSPVGVSATFTISTAAPPNSTIQFSSTNYSVGEGSGHVDVTVTRTGNTSAPATVNYTTADQGGTGHASQTSDYELALGTLTFAAGETSKTFRILIVDDTLVEGNETIDMVLWNTTGTGVSLGSPSTAQVTIIDNDTVTTTTNPYDDARFFVRQHYLDFLNREPDQGGWDYWTNTITSCGADAACTEVHRINVSAAYFLSKEFQNTGYLAYLTYRASFGPNASGSPAPVLYNNFMHDVQELGKGYVDLQPGADQVLEANKVAYFNEFVARPEFLTKYPSGLTNQQFVDSLLPTAGLPTNDAFHNSLINGLNGGTMTRANVLRSVAESTILHDREFNPGFVTMEYFGYLRRDPDTTGFNYWLGKLNDFHGDYIQAEMVKAFIESTEDRQRFGNP